MHVVQQKLYAWHQLYRQLDEARRRLQSQPLQRGGAPAAIKAEVERLRRDSDCALQEMQALLARRRTPRQATPCGAPRSAAG
jgi:hypothetical protein